VKLFFNATVLLFALYVLMSVYYVHAVDSVSCYVADIVSLYYNGFSGLCGTGKLVQKFSVACSFIKIHSSSAVESLASRTHRFPQCGVTAEFCYRTPSHWVDTMWFTVCCCSTFAVDFSRPIDEQDMARSDLTDTVFLVTMQERTWDSVKEDMKSFGLTQEDTACYSFKTCLEKVTLERTSGCSTWRRIFQ